MTEGEIRTGHDWLNVTFPREQLLEVRRIVSEFLGEAGQRDRGANTYRQSIAWETGCVLAWSDATDQLSARREAWLSMNGDSCDMVPPSRKLEMFQQLKLLGSKGTRVDARADCARDVLSMDWVHAAAEAGAVMGFRRYDPRRSRDMFTKELDEDQARFGSRGKNGSGRFVRVYDKGLESDGEIDAIRLEVELSGDVAELWFDKLCACSDTAEFTRMLGSIITSSIGFFDKTGAHHHADRFEILPWWKRITDILGAALKLSTARVVPALEDTVTWMINTFPRGLARIKNSLDCQGMNGDAGVKAFLRELLDEGQRKLQFNPAPLLDQGLDARKLFAWGT
jgi:hypothetical protein